jgi:LysR family cys regulon transcriptional activator
MAGSRPHPPLERRREGNVLDLQKLRGFYWAIQRLSFSEAAQKIHVSQSAVSHQVKSLEEELGVKLYERRGRGIVATPEGERLARYAQRILNDVDDLQAEFAELSARPHGTIRISAFRGIAMFQLPWIIRRFRRAHPEVRLTVASATYDHEIIAAVAGGTADIGFASSWNNFSDVDYFEILNYDMYVCTPLNHPWVERREPLTLNEITEQPLILHEAGTSIRRRIDEVFAQHGLAPDVAIEVGGFLALQEYVRIGLGLSIISGLMIAGHRPDVIHALPATDLFGRVGYGVVLRKGRYISSAVREFIRAAGVPDARIG